MNEMQYAVDTEWNCNFFFPRLPFLGGLKDKAEQGNFR